VAVYNSNLTSDLARLRTVLNDELPVPVTTARNVSSTFTTSSATPVPLLTSTLNGVMPDEAILIIASGIISASSPGDSVKVGIYINGASVHDGFYKANNDYIALEYIGQNLSGNVTVGFYFSREAGSGTFSAKIVSLSTLRFKRRN